MLYSPALLEVSPVILNNNCQVKLLGIRPFSTGSFQSLKKYIFALGKYIAPPGFEPGSTGPEPMILDRYTTGLYQH